MNQRAKTGHAVVNSKQLNRRILVVDDNPRIHNDFRKILDGSDWNGTALDMDEAALFDSEHVKTDMAPFELSFAFQGQEALSMVEAACAEDRPFTVAFVDVRMPPGWDGIETLEQIVQVDSEIQLVICTAFTDYSPFDILRRLGRSDRLLILKKPFDMAEVILMGSALNEKWHLARMTATLTEVFAEAAFEAK